jgi:colicin import membrane protein
VGHTAITRTQIVATTPPARARRTKAEVQQQFESIRRETVAEREAVEPRVEEALRNRDANVREAVEGVSVDQVVGEISSLGLHVSKSLSELSSLLVGEVERLATLREAVAIEQRELQRLHKVDLAAAAVDHLVQDYENRKQAFQAEAAATKAEWDAETDQRERSEREYEEALKTKRQRENDEFEYKKALERKKVQDKYDEEQRLRDRQNREKQEGLEKNWQEREATLKAREEELAQLRKDTDVFPKRLAQEVDRAVAEARRQAEQQLEQRLLIVSKDAEADRRVAELRIKALEEMLARQTDQVAALHKQLDEATQQVQDIAVKAIEGASGARALAHVNQIAMEQARTRPPQG